MLWNHFSLALSEFFQCFTFAFILVVVNDYDDDCDDDDDDDDDDGEEEEELCEAAKKSGAAAQYIRKWSTMGCWVVLSHFLPSRVMQNYAVASLLH